MKRSNDYFCSYSGIVVIIFIISSDTINTLIIMMLKPLIVHSISPVNKVLFLNLTIIVKVSYNSLSWIALIISP